MEFFDWMIIPQIVMQFFGQTEFETLEALIDSYINIQTISLYVAAGLYLICLIMGGLGMMVMAKRVGLKNRWMGFVPFLNTYYAGKLAGETRIFNQKMKRVGLYTMIVEIVYVAFNVFTLVIWFALMNPAYYATIDQADGSQIAQFDPDLVYDKAWMVTADTVCGILSYFVYFVLIFFMCILFYAFFRKYYARGPFLMTFLCAIPPNSSAPFPSRAMFAEIPAWLISISAGQNASFNAPAMPVSSNRCTGRAAMGITAEITAGTTARRGSQMLQTTSPSPSSETAEAGKVPRTVPTALPALLPALRTTIRSPISEFTEKATRLFAGILQRDANFFDCRQKNVLQGCGGMI